MSSSIDRFLDHAVWRNTHRARLVPLGESASVVSYAAGEALFKQFHPADQFSLLCGGSVGHETRSEADEEAWSMGRVSWPWGALGWSGFLPPHRNGTTARALTNVEVLSWRHEDLAQTFYADPGLAVTMFRVVLDSVRRQFEWIRGERLRADRRRLIDPLTSGPDQVERHRFAPSLISALRRSAFFERFEDAALERLAAGAELVRGSANSELVRQGEELGGLLVLAAGRAISYFADYDESGERLDRFRSIPEHGGILAGIPSINGGSRAEATLLAASTCWYYRIPSAAIEQFIASDPEFGRSFMQRNLARLAQLIVAARLPKPSADDEPEIAAVRSILDQNQTRIPVTSELHKVPHLLKHRLTVGNALACLQTARKAGRYEERTIARNCEDLLADVKAELFFYRDVLDAYLEVTDAPEDVDTAALRSACDQRLEHAFSHLRTEIHGLEHLPKAPGSIVIMNHLGCPAYYQFPNGYHFSFDTAFVSVMLRACYGQSPVRVVRQSPGAEYGHNLFYRRLGHITVPTIESGIEPDLEPDLEDDGAGGLARLRRRASETLIECGRAALAAGNNVLICPEGRSQKAADSPARLFSGAFRLALEAEIEPFIAPVAIAGFDQRYKDTKLVALIQRPFKLRDAMSRQGIGNLREFLDAYRDRFAAAVAEAKSASGTPAATASTSLEEEPAFVVE